MAPKHVRQVTAPFSYHSGQRSNVLYVYPRGGSWQVSDGMTVWFSNRSKPVAVAYAKVVADVYGKTIELMTKPLYP